MGFLQDTIVRMVETDRRPYSVSELCRAIYRPPGGKITHSQRVSMRLSMRALAKRGWRLTRKHANAEYVIHPPRSRAPCVAPDRRLEAAGS